MHLAPTFFEKPFGSLGLKNPGETEPDEQNPPASGRLGFPGRWRFQVCEVVSEGLSALQESVF